MQDSAEISKIIGEIHRRTVQKWSLEQILEEGMGLGKTMTPVQRAAARIIDDRPVGKLARHKDVIECIGELPEDEAICPTEVVLLCGTRGGKSLIAAGAGVRASQSCDYSIPKAGEIPRIPIVSLSRDLADVIKGHIVGNVMANEVLGSAVDSVPTMDTILLRHPSKKQVEIKVVAGSKAGASLVARWCPMVIFDEFTRMTGAGDNAINYDDMKNAVISRMLPGGKILSIGSPWSPFGPAYEIAKEHFGKPSKQMVVIWAPGDKMNPVWWTKQRIKEVKEQDPDAYLTDYLARFREPSEYMYSASMLEESVFDPKDHPAEGFTYIAAMDPATRSNAWTLTVGTRYDNDRMVVAAKQWVPSKDAPLDPKEVLSQIKDFLRPYRVTYVITDQWAVDALRNVAEAAGVTLVQKRFSAEESYAVYSRLKVWLTSGLLKLVGDRQMIDDLKRVESRPRANGGMMIVLPNSSNGRHCDYAPAVARLATQLWDDYVEPDPIFKSKEYYDKIEKSMKESAKKRAAGKSKSTRYHWR